MTDRRVFVCEFITGGGMADEALPESLAAEGEQMLQAVVRDFSAIDGVRLLVARDRRMQDMAPNVELLRIGKGDPVESLWRRAMRQADDVLVIAPESGGVLERISAAVLAESRRLLCARAAAVAVAASKLQTARLMERAGVPTVPTVALDEPWPPSACGWVVKPDDGVGCGGARRGFEPDLLREHARTVGLHCPVVQPYVEGVPGSVSFIARDGEARLLACNRQRILEDAGAFRLAAIDVAALEPVRALLTPLVDAIARALPGLYGFAGADFILTPSGPLVLEVNPRLTTAYAGLAAALQVNPAAMLLALDESLPPAPAPAGAITVEIGSVSSVPTASGRQAGHG